MMNNENENKELENQVTSENTSENQVFNIQEKTDVVSPGKPKLRDRNRFTRFLYYHPFKFLGVAWLLVFLFYFVFAAIKGCTLINDEKNNGSENHVVESTYVKERFSPSISSFTWSDYVVMNPRPNNFLLDNAGLMFSLPYSSTVYSISVGIGSQYVDLENLDNDFVFTFTYAYGSLPYGSLTLHENIPIGNGYFLRSGTLTTLSSSKTLVIPYTTYNNTLGDDTSIISIFDSNFSEFTNIIFTFDMPYQFLSFDENISFPMCSYILSQQYISTLNYNLGYADGYNIGSDDGYDSGYNVGYSYGHQIGLEEGNETDHNLAGIFLTMFDAPFSLLYRILNFEIWGVNFWYVFTAIISILLVLFVIRLIL